MCGIAGIINFNKKPVGEQSLRSMMALIKHRGPDDEGIFIDNNVGLGHVRLSILDLSPAGHQPMFSNDGRYCIVHNGEIYNYIELKRELSSKYKFQTNTDTEVILAAYQEWAEKCLEKFNGMWAFAIYDRETRKLFISRDRYGIKPFYYYADNEQLIFASEIPAILSILKNKPKVNNRSIFDYLVFNRTDQTAETFFEGIKKLQHGHNINIILNQPTNQSYEICCWYNIKERVGKVLPFANPQEYREIFNSAVGLRLRSDVPIGVCLSGGLDSSSIVSVLFNDYKMNELKTFSAVYGADIEGDESKFINLFTPLINNMFFTSPSAASFAGDIQKFIKIHAEPVPATSPYAQYKVMELASKHVVVTLDGQGADESLAGYHYFFGFYFKDLLKRYSLFKLFKEQTFYFLKHKSLYGFKTFLFFLMPKWYRTKLRVNQKGYLHTDFADYHDNDSVIANELYGSSSLREALLNHIEYKLEHLLKREDQNSMHFSLEARVPFLDHRLVERTLATDADKIINKGSTKYILREAMKSLLPEKIRTRKDKMGFGTPQDEWFRQKDFIKIINDLLDSESLKKRKIINTQKAKMLYNQHLKREKNIGNEIWKWVHLELWFREFID